MGLAICIAVLPVASGCGRQSVDTQQEVRTPHFNDSTPLHDAIFAAQPINVTLNFEVALADSSTVSVTSSTGEEWAEGPVLIEDVGTALRRGLRQGMPDGEYSVRYTACFLDSSCNEGRLSFSIDSSGLSAYRDVRGRGAVTVNMENLTYAPDKIIISPGTTVTWVNLDNTVHFVNTETHPEHTYFPEQNSLQLLLGDTWSVTFLTPGQYDYHCSAHYPEGMVGSIVVAP